MGSPSDALAQLTSGKDGIMIVPMQIDRENSGIAMIDTVAQTMWIYRINSRGAAYNRLELIAARSWRYDRQLKQYNSADPKPERVKALLEDLGRLGKNKDSEKPAGSPDVLMDLLKPGGND